MTSMTCFIPRITIRATKATTLNEIKLKAFQHDVIAID